MVNEVLPRLWLGDIKDAHNIEFLKRHSINCIINCTSSLEFPKYPCQKHRVSVKDNLQPDQIIRMRCLLNPTADLIHRSRGTMNILVHCHMGRQRSVSVILAYLLKYGQMTLKDSVNFLRTKRDCILSPGFNFKKALEDYETELLESRKCRKSSRES